MVEDGRPEDRLVRIGDLVGAAEIAARLDMSHPQSVGVLRRRNPDFPAPVSQLVRALIWNWPDVEAWARKTGRYPPRARTDD